MLYAIGFGIIAVLFLVGYIVHWWNLPAVAEARAKQTEARAKQKEAQAKERTERKKIQAEARANRRRRGTIEQPATMPAPEKPRRRPRRREATK